MKHALVVAPADPNPTLAELAWAGLRRSARWVRAVARSAGPRRSTGHVRAAAGSRHLAPEPGSLRQAIVCGSAVTSPRTMPSAHVRPASAGCAPARRLATPLRVLWRRPAFAAALAGTVAAALPLALLAGGNAHTFGLWRGGVEVEGGWVAAGDLDAQSDGWKSWTQTQKVGDPGTGWVPAGQWGNCLVPPEPAAPDSCGDPTDGLPLSAFKAQAGDRIELVGEFATELAGDNIAAVVKVDWAASPAAEATATYTLKAKGSADAAFTDITGGSSGNPESGVGDPVTVATVGAAANLSAGGSGAVAVLPNGIHKHGAVLWQITVAVEFTGNRALNPAQAAYPYNWVDPLAQPLNDPPSFVLPQLTWDLEQVRQGEGWGVDLS